MADPTADHHLDLLALCSLTAGEDRCDWGVIARQAHREGSLEGLFAGEMLEGTKRAHDTVWSIIFARMLIGYLEKYRNPNAVDIIIPNPSNPNREHIYPGCEYIEIIFRRAAELSSGNKLNFDSVDDPAVVKKYNTPPAARNNSLGRQQAAQWHAKAAKQHAEALQLSHEDRIRGKRVAVFDDICTTCHQLNEVACRLKKWGALKVYGIVLARSCWQDRQD